MRELRNEKELTQQQMATVLNVSKTTICQWETHKQEPSLEDLKVIAIFFNVSADYLIGLEDDAGVKAYGNNYNNFGIHKGNVNF